jgi:DNA topoisomerase-3
MKQIRDTDELANHWSPNFEVIQLLKSKPARKQTLKETDGLGTPATQANIMDTLFKRGYLEKRQKLVYSTPLGRDMINTLPEPVTLPDMTAQWEQQLAEIEKGVLPLNTFMTGVAR